ncbi:MAG: PqqD family protein [Deltaproteobacteria bacterium]|nr:PqqD family protein [Deltaproteobacteria bacterium]
MDAWELRFKRGSEVTWSEIEDECVLLHLSTGRYYTLNEVGRFMWKSLDGKKSLSELHRSVIREYDVDEQSAKQDILEVVQDLLKEGLLETDDKN